MPHKKVFKNLARKPVKKTKPLLTEEELKLLKLTPSAILELREKIDSLELQKGEDGLDGFTPIKGVDFFTEEEVEEFLEKITPVKGMDFRDGIDGQVGISGISGDEGEKGDKGEQGDKGDDGKQGDQGDKGDIGEKGKDGTDGIDGEDGKDGKAGKSMFKKDVKSISLDVADKVMTEHDKEFKHKLIHDSYIIGSKEISERGIKDGMALVYDKKANKLKYKDAGARITQTAPIFNNKKLNTITSVSCGFDIILVDD
tara:strand:- start:2384 stop:3151 length:768 start_codon:yes stop_codon:yes gene_type:complete